MKICTPLYVSFDSVNMYWLRKAPLILVLKIFVCLFVCFRVMVLQVAIFAGVFLSLAGAFFGFWTVRKLVLTEDGSIDMSTSVFVSWSIRIIAAVLILQVIFTVSIKLYVFFLNQTENHPLTIIISCFQSSVDPLLAGGALISVIIISSSLKKISRLKFILRLYE